MAQKLVPNPDIDIPMPDKPVGAYFPLVAPPPTADTFEIGLVLGGTVSAAAYTAGVVDFLLQALDAWTVAKETGSAPHHKVRLKIACGASGGAITSVLLSRILPFAFPHCDAASPAALCAANPLYDCWVNQIDIVDMLQLDDLAGGEVHSLLNANKIDRVGATIANYAGQPLGTLGTPKVRDYVEPHLPVVMTLTNLRGVPYSASLRGNGRAEYYTDYADHMRFVVDATGKNPLRSTDLRPFEFGIGPGLQPWTTIIHAARGSSAFPVGLPPQVLTRPPQHYSYRYAVIETNDIPEAVWMQPAWPYMIPIGATAATPYSFLTADGGCFNNEPTEYARQHLAGVLGRNARDGAVAHRAVLLVDPFADVPDYGLAADGGLLAAAGATASAFKNGARYSTADLDLFTDEDTYSRFLANPVRIDENNVTRTGGDAIATDTIAAFGGFLSRSYRNHDFHLGRRNCQQFLRKAFVLPAGNSLFDAWTPAEKAAHLTDGCLPIVPLVGALATEIPQPQWPKGTFSPNSIHELLSKRIARLADLGTEGLVKSLPWLVREAFGLAISGAGDFGADKAIAAITAALKDADLL